MSESPHLFSRFTDLVQKKNPLQKKMLQHWLQSRDQIFYERADTFANDFIKHLESENLSIEYTVDSYLQMCKEMLCEQKRFKLTGQYSQQSAKNAYEEIYSNSTKMSSYMYGLALSIFLWPNHYAMFDFFIDRCQALPHVSRYLEVGPGHGLYLSKARKLFADAHFSSVDISSTALDLAKSLFNISTQLGQCDFIINDIRHIEEKNYDLIVICEVLEHLDDPASILEKIYSLLHEAGHLFITTCANCPAIDHVYLYKSVEEIRHQLTDAGFVILDELPLGVGDTPKDQWAKQGSEVNYAALLTKGQP